jgi:hypothetical protein
MRIASIASHVLSLLYFLRSHKEKRSAYAPEKGVRYDGVYRIEKCWRKNGIQVERSLIVQVGSFIFQSYRGILHMHCLVKISNVIELCADV